MDVTSCKVGSASDLTFTISPLPLSCKDSIVGFWVFGGITILYRLLLSFVQVRVAIVHRDKRAVAPQANRKTRHCWGIPLTTSMEVCHTIFYILAIVLCGTDALNDARISLALFGTCCFFFFQSFYASQLKIVHLGTKVLPKRLRSEDNSRINEVSSDFWLSLCFTLMLSSNALGISGLAAPAFHPTKRVGEILFTIGLVSFGMCSIFGSAISLRQTSRLINYITQVENNSKNLVREQKTKTTLQETRSKLKFRTFGITLGGLPSSFLFFVGAGVGFRWYFAMLICFCATFGASLFTYIYIPKNMKWISLIWASSQKGPTTAVNEIIEDVEDGMKSSKSSREKKQPNTTFMASYLVSNAEYHTSTKPLPEKTEKEVTSFVGAGAIVFSVHDEEEEIDKVAEHI